MGRFKSAALFANTWQGTDFPSETFRVLKEKEIRVYGDASAGRGGWRAERVEAWDKMESPP